MEIVRMPDPYTPIENISSLNLKALATKIVVNKKKASDNYSII
jgi:hypothetical protein